MTEKPKPAMQAGSRLALQVDQRGLWVYANKAGLVSLTEHLLRLANADPEECFECHTRMELRDLFGSGMTGEVSLIVDKELESYFSRLPDDAPPDARPIGFELTFMHIDEAGLDELSLRAHENR